MDHAVTREKLEQVAPILAERQVDAWLTFTRENSLTPDPALALIAGLDVTWHSAFLFTRGGERIALVGRYDVENVQAIGGYSEVIGYDQSIRPGLQKTRCICPVSSDSAIGNWFVFCKVP